ncbi:MAG: site-specific DNA-methyltransferase [Lentisphaeria bacterium]|nr:site-specific DNA-methyltransferase [Lentisphaeria bacterium]
MSELLGKFQQLLRELFEFDCADLDFGIYRIMNLKRQVVERFIDNDLPLQVKEKLEKGSLATQAQAAETLEQARKKVLEQLGEEALDAGGDLQQSYRSTPTGKEYLTAREAAASARCRPALEAAVYNHLYAFFSRYWQDGDFISKRRYSRKERYAIPYNGEEVYLHWANHDQYYIKSGEYFNDYSWQAPKGRSVHFKLNNANVEQNNVKGEKRYFLPLLEKIVWDAPSRSLSIPFEFRPLSAQEQKVYGTGRQQENILASALTGIPEQVQDAEARAALTEKKERPDGTAVTLLEHHLRQYTRRNGSDFFIHKDLKGFLARELDFYLKNEVLNLDEMEAGGESLAAGWFQLLQLIKAVGRKIIEFLAQVEELQKMLWEKKKFVIEAFYVITVGNIPAEFYPEIVDCQAQWQEWQALLALEPPKDGNKRMKMLKTQPSLPLDTRHFKADFNDRLLAKYENLDEITDALLLNSENWQALNLMQEKYREQVKCVHIDPPYNTQTSGFLYKNDYQHSSWLAMMSNRLEVVTRLLTSTGHILSHIDENEYERLKILFDSLGIPDAGTVVWDKRNPMTAGRGVALQHEYIIWRSSTEGSIYQRNTNILEMLRTVRAIIAKYGGVTENARRDYAEWVRKQPHFSGGEKAYFNIDDKGGIYRGVSLRAPEPRTDPKFFKPLIHPETGKPCPVPPNGFSRTPETLHSMIDRGEILFGADETTQPQQKRFLSEDTKMQIRSVIQDAKKGKADLDLLGLGFPYCHAISLYTELIAAASPNRQDLVLDYFAGSGTTGHAVLNLNREDGGRRKFILVEMARYFDTVLLPRLKKVAFTPEWRDGRPRRMASSEEFARGPRLMKVVRLESYEDALNNLVFDAADAQQSMRFDDYLLKYMLRWETRGSETLLDLAKLGKPFDYKLHIHRDGQTSTRIVDLAETFNYLIGLEVQSRQSLDDEGRRYLAWRGVTRQGGQRTAVIWRETEGWTEQDYQQDRDFVAGQKLTQGADQVYVNGDSLIPGAQALEGQFKARMFAGEEV